MKHRTSKAIHPKKPVPIKGTATDTIMMVLSGILTCKSQNKKLTFAVLSGKCRLFLWNFRISIHIAADKSNVSNPNFTNLRSEDNTKAVLSLFLKIAFERLI